MSRRHSNLKKVILFLFATSIDEVAILLLALLGGLPLPLAAVQILWINIVTEGCSDGQPGDGSTRWRRDATCARAAGRSPAIIAAASIVLWIEEARKAFVRWLTRRRLALPGAVR